MKTGVLLINLGTPSFATPKAIKRYLIEFLSDKRVIDLPHYWWKPLLKAVIAPRRSTKVAKLYRSIWLSEGSPLLHYSLQLQRALAEKLNSDYVLSLSMTYGEPSIKTALASLMAAPIARLIVLPLYPQYSSTTTAAAWDALAKQLRHYRYLPTMHFLRDYADHRAYIEALAKSVERSFQQFGKPDCLVISYHGIPLRYQQQGDDYQARCQLTTEKLKQRLAYLHVEIKMVFQSRFGREPWLTPYADEVLLNLPKQGKRDVQVICPGFAVDCLETLEEVAKTNKGLFLSVGGTSYHYISALNASEDHIVFLQQLINEMTKDDLINYGQ